MVVLSSTIVHAQEGFKKVILGGPVLGLFLLVNQRDTWDLGLPRHYQSHSSAIICLTLLEFLTLQHLPQPSLGLEVFLHKQMLGVFLNNLASIL